MLQDILHDTPIYQLILQEGREEGLQEGIEKGREEGREERREGIQKALMTIVQARFPGLVRLTKKQLAVIEDPQAVEDLLVKVSIAQNEAEARQHLLDADKDEDET